jgi:hypothetical protein
MGFSGTGISNVGACCDCHTIVVPFFEQRPQTLQIVSDIHMGLSTVVYRPLLSRNLDVDITVCIMRCS